MSDEGKMTVAVAEPSELGECPVWSVDEQALYWVDIVAPAIKRLDPATGSVSVIAMPDEIGCVGLICGGGFVAAFRSAIWLLDKRGECISMLARNPEDSSSSRFNDGAVDVRGRLWVGTLDETGGAAANLYCLERENLQLVDSGLSISNGLAFSPNDRIAYHSDTTKRIIYRRSIDPRDGSIGPPETWLKLDRRPADPARPDGAAVDTEGHYWVAMYEGGRIARFAPDGRPVATYSVPALCPTMVAFGGSDLRTLYVTTARNERPADELASWPLSGAVFSMPVETPGQASHYFRASGA